eukprot:2662755-Rhodomonas_salina.5
MLYRDTHNDPLASGNSVTLTRVGRTRSPRHGHSQCRRAATSMSVALSRLSLTECPISHSVTAPRSPQGLLLRPLLNTSFYTSSSSSSSSISKP